jgi:hypothetical protein
MNEALFWRMEAERHAPEERKFSSPTARDEIVAVKRSICIIFDGAITTEAADKAEAQEEILDAMLPVLREKGIELHSVEFQYRPKRVVT